MSDPQHLEWLLEPEVLQADLWNLHRANRKFRPDFEAVNLLDGFAEAGRLSDSGRLPLEGVDFSYARFSRAVLPYADMLSADLQLCRLHSGYDE